MNSPLCRSPESLDGKGPIEGTAAQGGQYRSLSGSPEVPQGAHEETVGGREAIYYREGRYVAAPWQGAGNGFVTLAEGEARALRLAELYNREQEEMEEEMGTKKKSAKKKAKAAAPKKANTPKAANGPAPSVTAEKLSPGTILRRTYKGKEVVVRVNAEDFTYNETRYASLTSIAMEVTGYKSISGPNFFRKAIEEKAAA